MTLRPDGASVGVAGEVSSEVPVGSQDEQVELAGDGVVAEDAAKAEVADPGQRQSAGEGREVRRSAVTWKSPCAAWPRL